MLPHASLHVFWRYHNPSPPTSWKSALLKGGPNTGLLQVFQLMDREFVFTWSITFRALLRNTKFHRYIIARKRVSVKTTIISTGLFLWVMVNSKAGYPPEQAALKTWQLLGIQVAKFPTTAPTNYKTRLHVKTTLEPNRRILPLFLVPFSLTFYEM